MIIKTLRYVSYKDLPKVVQEDVADGLSRTTQLSRRDLMVALKGASLPLTLVNMDDLMNSTSEREVDARRVRSYTRRLLKGEVPPPIIINSSSLDEALLEGGHRAAAAAAVGMTEIEAIDLKPLLEELGYSE